MGPTRSGAAVTIFPLLFLLQSCAGSPTHPPSNAATAAEADAAGRAAIVVSPEPVAQSAQQDDSGQQTEPAPMPARPRTAPPVSDTQRRMAAGLGVPRSAPSDGPCRTVQLQAVTPRTYSVRQPDGTYRVQAEPVVTDDRPMTVCPPTTPGVSAVPAKSPH